MESESVASHVSSMLSFRVQGCITLSQHKAERRSVILNRR